MAAARARRLTPGIFTRLVPSFPYCADDPAKGVYRRPRDIAVRYRHIGYNRPHSFDWLLFDVDRRGAELACEDAILPEANLIIANPRNGHAHIGYLLRVPVLNFADSRPSALRFCAAVEQGLRRRLGADPGYTAVIAKNPLHEAWRVSWGPAQAYDLEELESWLFKHELRLEHRVANRSGIGRNCTTFDEVRGIAYGEIMRFKRQGGTFERWHRHCLALANKANQKFKHPLRQSELHSIAKSVSSWTWKHFTETAFSRRQSLLGKRGMASRWAGHVSLKETRPWEQEGVSRSTWFRRRAETKDNAE